VISGSNRMSASAWRLWPSQRSRTVWMPPTPGVSDSGAEDDGQGGQAVGPGMEPVGDEGCRADPSADLGPVGRDEWPIWIR